MKHLHFLLLFLFPVGENAGANFPTILIRLPYRPPGMPSEAFEILPPDIAWLAQQRWCDGNVGM